MIRTLLVLIGAVLGQSNMAAQNQALMTTIGHQLETMVDHYLSNRLLSHQFANDTSDLFLLFHSVSRDSTYRNQAASVHQSEMSRLSHDKGIQLRTGYAQNFAGAIVEEDGAFYDWRINAGLDWNLLGGGLISRSHQIKEKQLQWDAQQYLFDQQSADRAYRQTFDFIIYTFNQKKISLIQERLQLLDQLSEINSKLFYLKITPWETVLDLLSKKTETELFLRNYETYVQSVQLDSAAMMHQLSKLPIFNINFDQVERQGVDTLARYHALAKNLQALDHQYHWSKDVNLNTQLRYSYYNGNISALYDGRDFLSAGVSLALPIPFSRKATKKLVADKKAKLEGEYQVYTSGVKNELLTHFYEYQYSLKQFVHFFYKKERIAVLIERNLSQRNLEDPNYSPMQVVDRLDELFSVELELLDIQQKLYLKALKIFNLIGATDILPFIEILDYSGSTKRFASGTSIFCGKEDFADLAINYLVEYLQYNEIKEVLVNAASQPNLYIKYAELLDHRQALAADLNIRFMVRPDDLRLSSINRLKQEASFALTPHIHVDFRGFNLDTTQIDPSIYTHIVSVVNDLSLSFDVSVSLPLDGTEKLRKSLYPVVSKIHIVPEQSEELAGLYYLISGQTGEDPAKIQLVVNPRDFNSRLEMDSFSHELKSHLNLERISIADFQQMVDLERQTVGWNEERGF